VDGGARAGRERKRRERKGKREREREKQKGRKGKETIRQNKLFSFINYSVSSIL
jgi:hypothetical protein